jgi:hypothetical protein
MMRIFKPTLIAVSCYLLTLLLFSWRYHLGEVDNELFYNADALYLPSLFKNILIDGFSYADWTFAPSFYIFPDAIIYFPAFFLSDDISSQIFFYAIFQSILFFLLTIFNLSLFVDRKIAWICSALLCSNIILMGMFSSEPYGISFISSFHFGSVLSFEILIILLLKCSTQKSSVAKIYFYGLILFIGFASVLSDRIILFQFYLPILLIGIYYSISKINNEVLKIGILLLLGYLIAIILVKLFLPQSADLSSGIGFSSINSRLTALLLYAINLPLLIQISLLIAGTSFIYIVIYCYKHFLYSDIHHFKKNLLCLLFIVSAIFMFTATCLSDRSFSSRYFLPYLVLSPLFFFILASRKHFMVGIIVYSSLVSIGLLSILHGHSRPNQSALDVRNFATCVNQLTQKHSASRGIAQYWNAVPLYVFGNPRATVVSVINDLSPMMFIYNHKEISGKFSFAVIDNDEDGMYKISRKEIDKRLKNSPFEYQCSGKTILIFDRESISLPKLSTLASLRKVVLGSFIKNPRSLLIMAQIEFEKGNDEIAAQFFDEAISLLRENGAKEDIIMQYQVKKNEALNSVTH